MINGETYCVHMERVENITAISVLLLCKQNKT